MSLSTQLASNEGLLGFASGLVAGIVGVLTGYPLDTLKVKMQVYGNTASLLDGAATNTKNPVTVIRHLFRGVLPPLATTGTYVSSTHPPTHLTLYAPFIQTYPLIYPPMQAYLSPYSPIHPATHPLQA